MKVDLIAGFPGSGKTVWIDRYIRYLKNKGLKVRVIQMDFSPVGVDAAMLEKTGCEIVDLSGVCLRCGGAAKFQSMLIRGAMDGCDRVIVEAPGIYDAGEFFDVMELQEVKACCRAGSMLTVLDPLSGEAFAGGAGYLTFTQIFSAGTLWISKREQAREAQEEQLLEQADGLLKERGFAPVSRERICRKPLDQLEGKDFEAFLEGGCRFPGYSRERNRLGLEFESRETADLCENREDLEKRVRRLMSDPALGKVLRVKGHMQDLERNWYEVSGFPGGVRVEPAETGRGICSVVGRQLRGKVLAEAFIPRKSVREKKYV